MAKQFWEDAGSECNECRNMEREIHRLETKIDLLEDANRELKAELVRAQPDAVKEKP